jgi:hypothetical protein
LLVDEGIDILLNARIEQVSGKCGDSVSVIVEQNGIEKDFIGVGGRRCTLKSYAIRR